MSWQYILVSLSNLYGFIIVIYILMSWFPIRPGSPIGDIQRFLSAICEPFLRPFRKLIPPIGGMVDITPIIALLVLQFGVRLIVSIF